MAVQHRRVVPRRQRGDLPAERRPEARLTLERDNLDAFVAKLPRPGPRLVEAADRDAEAVAQAPDGLDDEPLGAARRQVQHDLQDAAGRRAARAPARGLHGRPTAGAGRPLPSAGTRAPAVAASPWCAPLEILSSAA